ncbi:MAG: phosphoserine phosphatase SerB [Actinomycetota bacterium]|jgi:phosphoserine phosphatase
MDVDSTLIQDEVIELLADFAGTREQVAAVTESAMRGEIDFEESLRSRVATLAGLSVEVLQHAYERVRLSIGARELIAAVHASGGRVGAVSGGFVQILEPLAKQLNLDYYRANTLEIKDGKLTGDLVGPIIDKKAKADALLEWSKDFGESEQWVAAIGDGANDLDMFEVAGLSFAYNAKPLVRERADVVIDEPDLRLVIPHLKLK